MCSLPINGQPGKDPAACTQAQTPSVRDTPSEGKAKGQRFVFWVCVILSVHLQLSLFAIPPSSITSGRPFASADYQTHYAQTTTLSKGLDLFGKHWVYDPDMLAGSPVGLIFDVDNKAHFLFTYGLTKLGVPRPTAFNLFVVLSFVLLPFSLLFAARLFGLRPRGQLFALGLGLLIWHFDSTAHYFWFAGMISWVTVAHLTLLVWALHYRMLTEHSNRYFYPLLLLLPLSLLVHVWTFAILAVPMIGLYLSNRTQLNRSDHLRVWGLAAAAIAVNLYWLAPALRHFYLVSPSGSVGQTNPMFILFDFLEIMVKPGATGGAMPFTFWRFVALAAALAALAALRKTKDGRFFYAALSLGWLFGLTYFAALIPGLRETEPVRFVIPLAMLAALVGGGWLAENMSLSTLRSWPRPAQAAVLILVVFILPRVIAPVVYFMPELSPPSTEIIEKWAQYTRGIGMRDLFQPATWKLLPIFLNETMLSDYIREECTEPGRILVQNWGIGEYLYWATDKPVIGGFPDRRLIHEAANIFHDYSETRIRDQEKFAEYLVQYNIRYLVVTHLTDDLKWLEGLLELKETIGPHRVFQARHSADYFQRGSGKVRAGLNRIEVTEAEAHPGTEELTLRFHHMDTLRCRPNCLVSRAPLAGDPAGFITVTGAPDLPQEFVVEHVY